MIGLRILAPGTYFGLDPGFVTMTSVVGLWRPTKLIGGWSYDVALAVESCMGRRALDRDLWHGLQVVAVIVVVLGSILISGRRQAFAVFDLFVFRLSVWF